MIRVMLMLTGAEAIRRRWQILILAGAMWGAIGLFIFIDSLDNETLIPMRNFGYLLILEGVFALIAVSAGLNGLPRRTRTIEGVVLILLGLLTIRAPWHSDIALALLLGAMFAVDGAIKIASARIIRFPGWKVTQGEGILSLILAVATLEPWPTWYVGTIGCNIGIALMLSSWNFTRLGLRLRTMPPGAPIATLLSRNPQPWTPPKTTPNPQHPGDLVVRVWTPTGGSTAQLIDRYIAAMDAKGTLSTGHAALEAPTALYISHYPAVEIDRTPGQLGKALRATAENDVPGYFHTSYANEAAEWCEATAEIRFPNFDQPRLQAFWENYRPDTTYNLVTRNCSTAVAQALDAALEGQLAQQTPRWSVLLRAMFNPQLWVASHLRRRAETMAWTPGLVLDYAYALSAVITPPDAGWLAISRIMRRQPPTPTNAKAP